ncbi:MAG: MBL fold metallo-hydrolase [Bdellovibrio sp.]
MITQILTQSPLQNFTYLIEHSPGKFWCLDPFDADEISQHVKKMKGELEVIINTHEHWDHHQGNDKLREEWGCEVWAHHKASEQIKNVNRKLMGGERLELADKRQIEILDTPGHTFAHLCLLMKSEDRPVAIFTGDTFFNAGVGNCRNGGDPVTLFKTIEKYFYSLPDNVEIYPGHDYLKSNLKFTLSIESNNDVARAFFENSSQPLTIKDERGYNLFLRLDEENLKQALQLNSTNREQVFLELRRRRDRW